MKRNFLINGAAAVLLMAGTLQAEEVIIRPETPADYGSGASARQDFYIPGEGAKEMFIGHPNRNTRGDRALIRFNLEPLLLKASLLKKAEIVLYFERMYSQDPEESRHIVIERLLDPVEELSGATVSSRNAEVVAEYDVKRDDLIFRDNPSSQARPSDPARFDITELLKKELDAGTSTMTIRISDTRAEAEPNDTGAGIGITLPVSPETIPQLHVELNNP
jgi:hypothetical protein